MGTAIALVFVVGSSPLRPSSAMMIFGDGMADDFRASKPPLPASCHCLFPGSLVHRSEKLLHIPCHMHGAWIDRLCRPDASCGFLTLDGVEEMQNGRPVCCRSPFQFQVVEDQGWCSMGKVWKFLQGKKTIITALVMGGVAFAQSMGYIDVSTGQEIFRWLEAAGLLAIRSAISKTEQVI